MKKFKMNIRKLLCWALVLAMLAGYAPTAYASSSNSDDSSELTGESVGDTSTSDETSDVSDISNEEEKEPIGQVTNFGIYSDDSAVEYDYDSLPQGYSIEIVTDAEVDTGDDQWDNFLNTLIGAEEEVQQSLIMEINPDDLTDEQINDLVKYARYEVVGMWLMNLMYTDQLDPLLERETSLHDSVWEVDTEGNISTANAELWELCLMKYSSTMISLMSWNDQFIEGDLGNMQFFMNFICDGETVGTYKVEGQNIRQTYENNVVDISLSYITGNQGSCSNGHNLQVNFTRMQVVSDPDISFWSGIRIYGSYVRPARYVVEDYATNRDAVDGQGFDAWGYTRFGTNSYGGNLDFDNPYILDAKFNTTAITDEFVFEANMYQIGLYNDREDGIYCNNYGASTYYLEVMPSGMSYRVDPNGGYYNGTKDVTFYENPAVAGATQDIGVPIWNSTTEGKTFIGWDLSEPIVQVNSDGSTKITSGRLSTTSGIKVSYEGNTSNGRYGFQERNSSYYGPYIHWDNTGLSTLTAVWQLDWVLVNFDTNEPSGAGAADIPYTSKQVYYNKPYGELPTPELDGYIFMGWYTDPVEGNRVSESTICKTTTTHTLYAHWQKSKFHLTFDLNKPSGYENAAVGGMSGYTGGKDVYYTKAYGYLPNKGNNNWPTPSISGVAFLGWFTSPVGGTRVYASTIYNAVSDGVVYAHWDEPLYLDTSVNLNYNPITISGVRYWKGGVDLDWSSYRNRTGYFDSYYKLSSSGSWTRTQQKVTSKTYANTYATDNATPNSISKYTTDKVGSNTRVSLTRPSDRGTVYNFYVSERTYASAGSVSKSFGYAGGVQSYTAPRDGTYTITLKGAASGSGQQGATVTGRYKMNAGQVIYFLVGGKGGRPTGGYNGGGAGGSSTYSGYGGGGATHAATVNRGLTSSYRSYSSNLLAVAAGAGGTGGNGRADVTFEGWGTQTSYAGTGGSSGNSGGNSKSTKANNSAQATGGFGGSIAAGGTNTTYSPGTIVMGYDSTSTRPGEKLMTGNASTIWTGSGGGGGAGWPGGGGGSAGWAFGSSSWSGGSGINKRPKAGGSGANGTGGAGGSGTYFAAYGGDDRENRSPFSSSGGGGGAGGQSANFNLTSYSYRNGTGGNSNGSASISLTEDLSGTAYKNSNTRTETVTTGVYGYRYVINTTSNTTVNHTNGSWTTSDVINVPNKSTGQWLHVAPVDRAGNVGSTIHIYIEPTYTISYIYNGGSSNPENPGGYTPSTPTFTLTRPTKPGSEFIGWTGSNGSTPQLDVTIPKGSTGNKTYEAHWAEDVPYVSNFTLEGDVYSNAGINYVKAGYVFDISFYSYVKDEDGNVVGSQYYTPTNNVINVKDRTSGTGVIGEYIQSREAELPMTEFFGRISNWTYGTNMKLNIFDYTVNTRTTAPYGSTEGYQYFNTEIKANLINHLDSVVLYPQAGVIKGDKESWSTQFDESKRLILVADSVAPIITDNITDDGVYTEGQIPININAKDKDAGESGVKSIVVEITNSDTNVTKTYTQNSGGHKTSVTYNNTFTCSTDPDFYNGKLHIKITATDNVNNVSTVEKDIFVISLETEVKRVLPNVDINGNPIPDNMFKEGEQGYLVIKTTGYIDKLEIEFDGHIKELAKEQGSEIGDLVEIPLPNNTTPEHEKNENTRTYPTTDPDTLKPVREDDYFFYVPMDSYIENPEDPDDNTHYIIIRAYKEDKELSNVITIGVGDDDFTTDDDIIIDDTIEGELRTRIRERGN